MKRHTPKSLVLVRLFLLSLLCTGILLVPMRAFGEDSFSTKVENAGKTVEKSVNHAADKTGTYLKSDSFHQKLKKITNGIGNAIQKGGNWIGHHLDSLSKPDSSKH